MKTRSFLAVALLLVSVPFAPAKTEVEAWSYTGTDIYPSAIIATALVDWNADGEEEGEDAIPVLGDRNGWVGARLLDVPAGSKVKVEVTGEGWLKTSKVEVVVEDDEEEVIVMPKGVFDFDALRAVRQQKPANLSVKVTLNGKQMPEQNEVVTLRSINECPFAVIFGEGDEATADDLSWMFAAYVNENHPWIDSILKEALDAKLVDSFDGYQSKDPEKVIAQVFAIWHVLQRHGMKYSDITNTPKSKFAAAQTVRFLDDSIKATQANCVDGSVIFASILTKISINCGLVLVPGHCFVCFDLDPDGELDVAASDDERTVIGLETTMLGSTDLKPVAELKNLPAKTRAKVAQKEGESSAATFGGAIDVASQVFSEHGAEFDEDGSAYQVIPIAAARELGIMPIASGESK
ncbi:hypothetical protein [Prosthecobacter sp.]|uniref:hypothetical protein n=1 Tax=Prosthecobacter sp. TaxID=1965333 RepID=UPI001D46178A|nr:hypothetical protein [Prosthecobacter sp.]MCB1277741.1 hypothetical protein [Prosthecobacter sp.]